MTTAELSQIAKLDAEAMALVGDGLSPSKYIALLTEKELYKDAVKFLAHGMPVPIAIKWGLACVKELKAPDQEEKMKASAAIAESWTQEPSDQKRWEAKKIADASGMETAADCLAMAVFLSGGSIAPDKSPPVPPPPHSANKMVAGAIQIAVASHQPEKSAERFKKALELGRAQAQAKSNA